MIMVSMLRWAIAGGIGTFVLLYAMFMMAFGGHDGNMAVCAVLAFGNAISAAAACALFAGMKLVLSELRETQRQLKHWQSIQSLDIGLDEPSTLHRHTPPYDRD